METLIDLDDFQRVDAMPNTWSATIDHKDNIYVHCMVNGKRYKLHRLIMNAPKHLVVDHINRDTLDNRKGNLRLCTRAENMQNVGVYSTSRSGVRNVMWNEQSKKWIVQIRLNGKNHYFGSFNNIADAEAEAIKQRKTLMPFSVE